MPVRPILPLSRNLFCFFIIMSFLFFSCNITFGDVIITPDRVNGATFKTSSAICYGDPWSHINFGFLHHEDPSVTGTEGEIQSYCTVSGGSGNTASQKASTVGGGESNVAAGHYSTISGGAANVASGTASTIGGGESNRASGIYSTVSGGWANYAGGDFSWAGGSGMQLTGTADHTFVWGYTNFAESISTANAFLIFPAGTAGKVGIGTPDPRHLLDLGSALGKKLAVYQGPDGNSFYGFGISSNTLEIYAGADVNDNPAMVVKKNNRQARHRHE